VHAVWWTKRHLVHHDEDVLRDEEGRGHTHRKRETTMGAQKVGDVEVTGQTSESTRDQRGVGGVSLLGGEEVYVHSARQCDVLVEEHGAPIPDRRRRTGHRRRKETDEEGEMSTVDEMGRTLTASSASWFNGELIDRSVVGTRSIEKTGGDAVSE
jgi:hypothetical protein